MYTRMCMYAHVHVATSDVSGEPAKDICFVRTLRRNSHVFRTLRHSIRSSEVYADHGPDSELKYRLKVNVFSSDC